VVDILELEPARPSQRLLATVLFTDIVDSTERARAVGDQRWRELLELHDQAVRRPIDQAGGRLIKSTGDDILAVFDGPGRGLRCVLALRAELRASEIQIRAGLHTGEGTSAAMTWEGSRPTSAPVSWPPPARVRSWCPAPSGTSWSALTSGWRTAGHTPKGIGDQWQLCAAR
jgi:class 3 adenylate cyclase